MAILQIRTVPDPVLRRVSDPVSDFDDGVGQLANDMLQTMYAATGRGIAAPQVGVLQRLFVMDATWKSGDPTPQVFVNPLVLSASDTTATLDEGCLSIPDQTVTVTRPAEVTLGWQDAGGVAHQATFAGFAAACVQHEIDHLNGILITEVAAA